MTDSIGFRTRAIADDLFIVGQELRAKPEDADHLWEQAAELRTLLERLGNLAAEAVVEESGT